MHAVRKTLSTLALASLGVFAVGVGSLGAVAAAPDHADSVHGHDIPRWVVTPCATEDSVNCRWNAKTQGNGHGHSFVVRAVPGRAHMVCVFYTVPRYAKHHDYCS